MIVRRLATSLQKQDWMAVSLEILIVVVGVFLGLQVNNWNEDRLAREAERDLILRLEVDLQDARADTINAIASLETLTGRTGILIDLLRAEETVPDRPDMDGILGAAIRVDTPPGLSATYQEMISTGSLSSLQSEDLRRSLTQYGQLGEVITDMANAVVRDMMAFDNPDSIMAAYDMPGDWSRAPETMSTSVDWPKLRRARGQVRAIWVDQNVMLRASREQLTNIDIILALLRGDTEEADRLRAADN